MKLRKRTKEAGIAAPFFSRNIAQSLGGRREFAPSKMPLRTLIAEALSVCLITICVASATAMDKAYDEDVSSKPLSSNCVDSSAGSGAGAGDELPADSPFRDFTELTGGRQSAEKSALEACPGQVGYDESRLDTSVNEDKTLIGTIVPIVPNASCAFPTELSLNGGLRDNYALPQEQANLTNEIKAAAGNPPASKWTAFDSPNGDLFFGHNIPMNFSGRYLYGTLWMDIKSVGGYAYNDTISIWAPGSTSGGWYANVRDIARIDGQNARIALNLGQLRSGSGTVLDDINSFKGLNVFIQDDMAVDNMRVTLSCVVPADVPLVGVIRTSEGCGDGDATQHNVFLDNEDNRNRNGRYGWIGATVSNQNTEFRVCAVDGNRFVEAANAGASFALMSLSGTCPRGFTRFDRFHDNEDNRPASWDTAPAGSPTTTVGSKKDTNMSFCVATGTNPRVSNGLFPSLGFSYGVFGGRTQSRSPWALQFGGVNLDDEDRNNRNQPGAMPSWTSEFVIGGANTSYFMARVK